MPPGIELIHTAASVLTDGNGPLRDRLLDAAPQFVSALAYQSYWPQSFRERAEDLAKVLSAGGSAQVAVNLMDEDTVPAVAGEIVEFAEDSERFDL